jgi:hypothetical protein
MAFLIFCLISFIFMLKEIYKAKFEQDDDAILEISKRLKLLFKNTKITIEHNIVDN